MMATIGWWRSTTNAARNRVLLPGKLTFLKLKVFQTTLLFEAKVFHAHKKTNLSIWQGGSQLFQPKAKVLSNSLLPHPKQMFSKQTFSKQTFSQKQTNHTQKGFVFEVLKLTPTEFVLSFQFRTNVSENGLFRAQKLTCSQGKRWFWE